MIAVDVRSTDVSGEGVYWADSDCDDSATSTSHGSERRISTAQEMNYTRMLNSQLPDSIRVLAWSPVLKDFNARHHCQRRSYLYILPKGPVDLKVSPVLSCPQAKGSVMG